MQSENIARFIDHTALKATTTPLEIEQLCREALEFEFFSVCVNSLYIPQCKSLLKGSSTKVCTVVDFPLGASSAEEKALLTKMAIENGAEEVDMVIPIGLLKNKDSNEVLKHIKAVVQASGETLVKVIIETALLTHDEKVIACELVSDSGAEYIKTSTGFSTSGAQIEDILLFKKFLKPHVKIKASGGIRDYKQAQLFINAGCSRLGVSSGVQIVKEAQNV
jgi:deoxyribose-phosphate aldolase